MAPPSTSPILDLVLVGGGIVGLATAMRLLERHPGLKLAVLEKEARLATQQTGHNSGVIHSGVYYTPGSMKARTCVAGSRALYRFCDEHGIRYERCGKLIVALHEGELDRLEVLHQRGLANGVDGLEMVGPQRMREIEPHTTGVRGLYISSTGVVDYTEVAEAYAGEVLQRGGEIHLRHAVTRLHRRDGLIEVDTPGRSFVTRHLVACAGLYSDRVARLSGGTLDLRIVPFRGDYYVLRPEKAHLCRALLYPVPDPSFPFLGVHYTRRLDGSVWAGPNAVLALARQGYGRWDLKPSDLWETLSWPGFWRLALRFWRTGVAEMWRDYYKPAYVRTMQAYVPEVRPQDVLTGPSGVRAQALDRQGTLVDDFALHESAGMIHVLNAPSPAATSSLAIADMIVERAERLFALGARGAATP